MDGAQTWLLIAVVYTVGHIHGSLRQRRRMERRAEQSADWVEQTVADALYGTPNLNASRMFREQPPPTKSVRLNSVGDEAPAALVWQQRGGRLTHKGETR